MKKKDESILTPEEEAIWKQMVLDTMEGDLEDSIAREFNDISKEVRDFMARQLIAIRRDGVKARLNAADKELV
jgi:hypothetical protein